jgi:hypothetical protein
VLRGEKLVTVIISGTQTDPDNIVNYFSFEIFHIHFMKIAVYFMLTYVRELRDLLEERRVGGWRGREIGH